MNENNKNNQQQIQIEVPNEEMQGKYANLAVITHGPNDFFFSVDNNFFINFYHLFC